MTKRQIYLKQRGFSILEVVIGIFVFVVGMMALAALQGALTRAMTDAKVRTTAASIAERTIERQRGFSRLMTDPGGQLFAYNNITSSSSWATSDNNITNSGSWATSDKTISANGVIYTIDQVVTDYYYSLAADGFCHTGEGCPTGMLASTYKQVEVTVSWNAAQNFRGDEGTEISADNLGGDSIKLTSMIPALVTSASALVVESSDSDTMAPPVSYTPGLRPEIVALDLGDSKFKESTTPEPEVFRGEVIETTFDVITFAGSNNFVFLRREEFKAVSCECILRTKPDSADLAGRRPTIWAADEYEEGEFVRKPYGEEPNASGQSSLCGTCCQDHHDGNAGGGSNDQYGDPGRSLYNPWRGSSDYFTEGPFEGDHKHYSRANDGTLLLAETDGVPYEESCRLIRKDGFFRVAQDIRREGLNVFPEDYLDHPDEVATYSTYVTESVDTFENSLTDGYETADPPPALTAPAVDLFPSETTLPTFLASNSQQLRSRAIYIDYMSEDLRTMIDCLRAGDKTNLECSEENATIDLDQQDTENVLTIIPFFDVQMTFLNRWVEELVINPPVEVSNQEVLTNNAHSRGVAELLTVNGTVTVMASGSTGNRGLTDTDSIDEDSPTDIGYAELEVVTSDTVPPPPDGTDIFTGDIKSGKKGFNASSVTIESTDMICNRLPDGYICYTTGSSPVLKLIYGKPNVKLVACSANAPAPPTKTNSSDSSGSGVSSFSFAGANSAIPNNFIIELNACT